MRCTEALEVMQRHKGKLTKKGNVIPVVDQFETI